MMDSNRKPRDYKSLWMISLVLIALGIVLTINLSMLRAIGFVMLGIGGVGMIVSITNMDKWKDKESEDDEKKRFS